MLKKLKKNNSEGFTIIEVMIVLAIAGLILLIVFLAVPALQRNSRNTSRKNDASRVAGAVGEFISNHNGTLPSTAANANEIRTNAGTFGQYNITGGGTALTANQIGVISSVPGSPPAAADNEIGVYVNATCNAASGFAQSSGATTRSVAVVYPIEQSGGTFIWNCVTGS